MIFKFWLNSWLLMFMALVIVAYTHTVSANSLIPKETVEDLLEKYDVADFKTINSVDYRQLRCMSTAIWYESGHEPRMGKIAVARVIQNRTKKGFGDTPCDVINQKSQGVCQFSWACSNYHHISTAECRECWQIATQVLAQNQYSQYMKHALFFHATYVTPGWSGVVPIAVVGNHKFYRKF
jgi:spore germination cell wall hydrolase CwlJ-like protein